MPAPRILHVGKDQAYSSIAAAAVAAKDADVVEIEAGDYVGDVAVWTQKKLVIRGVHGRVRLYAGGTSAEGKAIWVFRQGDYLVDNIEFIGTRVADLNGAGIRFEKGHLVVQNCVFHDNQTGLLASDDHEADLEVKDSEFFRNGFHDGGIHHNLYVGQIARLRVTGSYFHHAVHGHLFKSRARESFIFYNRMTDELGGEASYELEFPNGGVAYVVGNIVQQGAWTENPHLISFGAEGYTWPRNELYLVNNTLVDDKPRNGIFLRVNPGVQRLVAMNNLLVGKGDLESAGPGEFRANFHAEWRDMALAPRQDYRLKPGAPAVGKAVAPGTANGVDLRAQREYVYPRGSRPLDAVQPFQPGALQTLVAP